MSAACHKAREIVSAAYDGEKVTVEELRAAKTHCASCAGCTAYVSGLAKLRAVAAPTIPTASLDRALEAVAGERSRDRERAAIQAARARAASAEENPATQTETPLRAVARWSPWTSWAAAAAAVLIVVGVVTWRGVVYLGSTGTESSVSVNEDAAVLQAPPPGDATESYDTATGESSGAWGDKAQSYALRAASAPPYVVFSDFVFSVETKELRIPLGAEVIGSLTSDLGSGTPAQREVYAAEDTGQILIQADSEDVAFLARPVLREYDGRTYALQSPDITVYGTWPSLPSGLPQPSSEDGSPDYRDAGEDALGVTVYTQRGKDPAAGFALPPRTSESDPAAGNPNWTWWAPFTE